MFLSKVKSTLIQAGCIHVWNSVLYNAGRRGQFVQLCTVSSRSGRRVQINDRNPTALFFHARCICNKQDGRTGSDADVFGTLSYEQQEQIELDEHERAEEEFGQQESSAPQRQYASRYATMIKSHVKEGALDKAVDVLDVIKKNRDKPNAYMYNLLIYAFAQQGDLKRCFRLYNDMKKRGLKPTPATYTSLINVCAIVEKDRKQYALAQLEKLRLRLDEKRIPLNTAHYNAMIKVYAYHGEIPKAFEVADLMRDRHVQFTDETYSSLLSAAIADKEHGLRHALVIWHLMRKHRVKPNGIHYDLLTRAIRDTKLGDLKVDDVLVPNAATWTRVVLAESGMPDLLASPPVLTKLLTATIGPSQTVVSGKKNRQGIVTDDSSPPDVALTSPSIVEGLISQNLNEILTKNRLILFGGLENYLQRMTNDNCKPTTKTLTILVDIVPPTIEAENRLIAYARKNQIKLDIAFYNSLMKKRCMRFDYGAAKDALYLVQQDLLIPDVITYGVLALGCSRRGDARELITEMENVGCVPNTVIMETLVKNAVIKKDVQYTMDMMKYMEVGKITPKRTTYNLLDSLAAALLLDIQAKNTKRSEKRRLGEEYKTFMKRYKEWQEKMGR